MALEAKEESGHRAGRAEWAERGDREELVGRKDRGDWGIGDFANHSFDYQPINY